MVFGDWLRRVRHSRRWSHWTRRVPQRRRQIPAAVQIETLQRREMLTTQIDLTGTTVPETDGGGNLTINLSGNPLVNDLTLTYTVTSITASGADYSLASGTLTILATESSGMISFGLSDDAINETAETFEVTISSPSEGTIGTDTATVTITDDDSLVVVGLISAAASEDEADDVLTFQATHPSGGPLLHDLLVSYTVTNGTASSSDFSLTTGSTTIFAGSNDTTVTFSVTDDTEVDPGETFTVAIDSVEYGTIGTPSTSVSIADDDVPVEVSVESDGASEDVGAGSVTFRATIVGSTDPLTTDLMVHYTVTAVTATSGSDYSFGSGWVVIPAGSNEVTVPFVVNDDTDIDPGEFFTVTINSVDYGTITTMTAVVGIADNDGAPVIDPGQLLSVAENSLTNFVVGFVTASSPSGLTLQDWTLSDPMFQIDSTTGQISVKDSYLLDYEALVANGLLDVNGCYSVTVTVGDGVLTSLPEIVLIQVTDVAEPALPTSYNGYLPTDHPDHFQEHGLPAADPRLAIQAFLVSQSLAGLQVMTTDGLIREFNGEGVETADWDFDSATLPPGWSYIQTNSYAVSPGVTAIVTTTLNTLQVDVTATAADATTGWDYDEYVRVDFVVQTLLFTPVGLGSYTQAGSVEFEYDGNATFGGYEFVLDVTRDVRFTADGKRYEQTRSGNWFSTQGEREKTIETYEVSVTAAPIVSKDYYDAHEETTVTVTNGEPVLFDIDLSGSGNGNWDETRTDGDSKSWVMIDDYDGSQDGSKDYVERTYNRTLHSEFNFYFNYNFSVTQGALTSTAYYGAPLPDDGTNGTRFDQAWNVISSVETTNPANKETEHREFFSKENDAGLIGPIVLQSPDDIYPRKTEVTLDSDHSLVMSSESNSNFDQTFTINATTRNVALKADGNGESKETITSGEKTEFTKLDAGITGGINFVRNRDNRKTFYNSDSTDKWTSKDGDHTILPVIAIVTYFNADGTVRTRGGEDYRRSYGEGTSQEWGYFDFDHEWKLKIGDRTDYYHGQVLPGVVSPSGDISPNGTFNVTPNTDVVAWLTLTPNAGVVNQVTPGSFDGYSYTTKGTYTGNDTTPGTQTIKEINTSQTTTTTDHFQYGEYQTKYDIGSGTPHTFADETKKQKNYSHQVAIDRVDDDFTIVTTPFGGTISTKDGHAETHRESDGNSHEIIDDAGHTWERQEVKTVDGGQSVWHQEGTGTGEQHTTTDKYRQTRREIFVSSVPGGDSIELTESSEIRSNSKANGESDFTYDYTKGDLANNNGRTEHEEGTDHFTREGLVENDFFTWDPAALTGGATDGTVTILGSNGNDPDEQGKRKKHFRTLDTHTEWGTGTYEDHEKGTINGRLISRDDTGNLSWNDDPATDLTFANKAERVEDILETLASGKQATIVTDRWSKSNEKQVHQRINGDYQGQASEGDVTLPSGGGSSFTVGDNGFFSRESESYYQRDEVRSETDFEADLTDTIDSSGVLTTTGTDNRKWETWNTSDRSGNGSWEWQRKTKDPSTGASQYSTTDGGQYTFSRHTYEHDNPKNFVTYYSSGQVTDRSDDIGDGNSRRQFEITSANYLVQIDPPFGSGSSESEGGPYRDKSDSWTQHNYHNDVTTTYLANTTDRELRGTKTSNLYTWGEGTYLAQVINTLEDTDAIDQGARDYQTWLKNVTNVDTDISIVEVGSQTIETHTIRDNGFTNGNNRSNLDGTLTFVWTPPPPSAGVSVNFSSTNVYKSEVDEFHNGSWTDDLITTFVTDSNGTTTSSTSGTMHDDGRTHGKNTRTNHDTISRGRNLNDSANSIVQNSTETFTDVNDLIVDFDHKHDNLSTVSNDRITQIDSREHGTNTVTRKVGKVNATETYQTTINNSAGGVFAYYNRTHSYNDYDHSTVTAAYDDLLTTVFVNGQAPKVTGTKKVTSGSMTSGHVYAGTDTINDMATVSTSTPISTTQTQTLNSTANFTNNRHQNLSTVTETTTLANDGSVTNQRNMVGSSGTTQNYSETGAGNYSLAIGYVTLNNGSIQTGSDTFVITSNNNSNSVLTLNMTSNRDANGVLTVDGTIGSDGGGGGNWIADHTVDSTYTLRKLDPGVEKFDTDATYNRNLKSELNYSFDSNWNWGTVSATGVTTFGRSDSGQSDLVESLKQKTDFHDVLEYGDLAAPLNHNWTKIDFRRDTDEPGHSRVWHFEYGSSANQTQTGNSAPITSGSYQDSWTHTATTNETINERLRIDTDLLQSGFYPPYGIFTQHEWSDHETVWVSTRDIVWNASGGNQTVQPASGAPTFSGGSSGTRTENGTFDGWNLWHKYFTNSSGGSGMLSGGWTNIYSNGPIVTDAPMGANPWFDPPRNYFSGGSVPAGFFATRYAGSFGVQWGAYVKTPTHAMMLSSAMPSMETYYAHPTIVNVTSPTRPTLNGHAAETGGSLWSSERDGAERVRNVEHIRGLKEADLNDELLRQPIGEASQNPWSTFGLLPVAVPRRTAFTPPITELPINVTHVVPASEVQGMAETLRRHYQSEATAETLDTRDRSLQMPPRTVGDANPQLTGWLAQVAQSNGKLTLDPLPLPATAPPPGSSPDTPGVAPDTPAPGTTTNAANVNPDLLRRADSGKFDHGGAEQTKALADAYKNDPVPEANDDVASDNSAAPDGFLVARKASVLNAPTRGSELDRANANLTSGYTLGVKFDRRREFGRTNPGFYAEGARADQLFDVFAIVQSAKELKEEIRHVQRQLWNASDFRRHGPWLSRFSDAPANWKRTTEEKRLQAKIQELQVSLEDLHLEFQKKGYDRFEFVGVPTGGNEEGNRSEVRGKGLNKAIEAYEKSLTKVGAGGIKPAANLGEVYLELTGIRGLFQLAKGGVQLTRAGVRAAIAARVARGGAPSIDLFAILRGRDVAALSKREVGDLGEEIAKTFLGPQGYTEFVVIKNASNQGIDLLAKNTAGNWVAFEVKTSRVAEKMWGLSSRQKNMEPFLRDILGQAANGTGRYAHLDAASRAKALEIWDVLRNDPDSITGFLIQVNTTDEIIRMSPWLR